MKSVEAIKSELNKIVEIKTLTLTQPVTKRFDSNTEKIN